MKATTYKTLIIICIIAFSYSSANRDATSQKSAKKNVIVSDKLPEKEKIIANTPPNIKPKSSQVIEQKQDEIKDSIDNIFTGLVNIRDIDTSILVSLKYSTKDNFLKKDIYGNIEQAFLQKEAAMMLAKAQKKLKKINSDYSLLVYDCARPLSVQQKMWELVKNTNKEKYVANPAKGSIHNYGAAVDLTIAKQGEPLDMGTPFDFFGPLAEPALEKQFLKEGKLTMQQINNRKLLRDIMTSSGFQSINVEWWHFNAYSNEITKNKYNIIQ